MTIKQIYLTKHEPMEHLLGKFLDESYFDILLEEDCDVYKPIYRNNGDTSKDGESNLLMKFRKNVFSPKIVAQAYNGLKDAAQQSQNRGVAAGPRTDKSTGPDWVTLIQEKVLDALSGTASTIDSSDPVESIYTKYKSDPNQAAPRGSVWLTNKRPTNFDFDVWAQKTKHLSAKQRQTEVEQVYDWISDTSYANPVNSGIAGYFDRYPRIPYCRTTAYTAANKENFDTAIPFIEAVSNQFKTLIPGRYEAQQAAMAHLDPSFRVGNSVYTTITVNKTYRTAAHRDAGDLHEGFGNLTCVWDGNHSWEGAYLVFPEYRCAVNVRPGDMLAMDVHEIHGNTPITSTNGDHERISVVCYMREKMSNCQSKAYETARFNFVESRRLNPQHPLWFDKWNGVSSSMWDTQEWQEYLLNNGLHEYAAKVNLKSKFATLDI